MTLLPLQPSEAPRMTLLPLPATGGPRPAPAPLRHPEARA